jgi:hypothetical protein
LFIAIKGRILLEGGDELDLYLNKGSEFECYVSIWIRIILIDYNFITIFYISWMIKKLRLFKFLVMWKLKFFSRKWPPLA